MKKLARRHQQQQEQQNSQRLGQGEPQNTGSRGCSGDVRVLTVKVTAGPLASCDQALTPHFLPTLRVGLTRLLDCHQDRAARQAS